MEVRTKPSHAWRDGEAAMPGFANTRAITASDSTVALQSGKEAVDAGLPASDEMDYLATLLGKSLVDLMWKIFVRKQKTLITTRKELEARFLQVEQRKTETMVPLLEMPVTSFAGFLSTYVRECVRHSQQTSVVDNNGSSDGEDISLDGEKENIDVQAGVSLNLPSVSSAKSRRRKPTTMSTKINRVELVYDNIGQNKRPLLPQSQRRPISRLVQHTPQPTIQPEPQTRQKALLRVKKTRSQRMAEALARARLAEYDARRKLQDERCLASKKVFVRDKTKGTLHLLNSLEHIRKLTWLSCGHAATGAAALEIVNDFMKSPLMDKFGRGNMPFSRESTQIAT